MKITVYTYNVSLSQAGTFNVIATEGNANAPSGTVYYDDTTNQYKITFTGLNVTSIYYVTEEPVDGYRAPKYADKDLNEKLSPNENYDKAYDGEYIINLPMDAVELPSTGGPGTKLYHIFGVIMIFTAGALLLIKRKRGLDLIPKNW